MPFIMRLVFAVCLSVFSMSALAADSRPGKQNRLANEASPYLRQHATNPVDWYPWGKEAFDKARKENKPILLSIGYSTCYWCHVMERESYSNEEIAAVVNQNFVAVKVDRERRPEVDETYMLAAEILNQSGGWPNNVFLTPELKPFAAVTYLPKTEFKQLMTQINEHWRNNPGPVMAQAERTGSVIASFMQARVEARNLTPQLLKSLVDQTTQWFDEFHGGIGVAPKFPRESLLLFLLDQAERNLNPRAREVALKTLDGILAGGIRDQIGGGFHRYAVDPEWRVPHFEKMLYNQALISQALVQAHRMSGAKRYATALRETLDHVIRDMQLPAGGFATAFDAESKTSAGKKKEGAFYVWTPTQIAQALDAEEATLAGKLLGITKDGNFHGTTIPHLPEPLGEIAAELGTSADDLATRLAAIKAKLIRARASRPLPLRDDKILTGWNALMIRAMADAAIGLAAPRYAEAAEKAAAFLWRAHYEEPGELRRYSFEGKTADLAATQPDHAYLGLAFLALFDATREARWLERAETIAAAMHKRFHDAEAGDYVMARTDDPIPPAKIRSDQPVPSGNATALELYAKLARRSLSPDNAQRAHALLAATSGLATRSPASSGYVLKAGDELLHGEVGTVQYVAKGRVRVTLTRPDAATAILRIAIAEGWHINAHRPLEDYFIATTVTLAGPDNPKPTGVTYPEPLLQKLGFAENKLALYEGEFSIPIALPKSGKPPRAVQFQAQACSDKICLDPETLSFTLTPMAAN